VAHRDPWFVLLAFGFAALLQHYQTGSQEVEPLRERRERGAAASWAPGNREHLSPVLLSVVVKPLLIASMRGPCDK